MRESTASRIKQIMSEQGLRQVDILNKSKPYQDQLGIKMSKSTLSQYVNGIQSPDQNRIYLLSKTLDINEAWLMGFDVAKERTPDDERDNPHSIVYIYNQLEQPRQKKVYSFAEKQLEEQNAVNDHSSIYLVGQTAAGPGVSYSQINAEQINTSVPNGADYALTVKGDSMEPLIKDGEIIFYKEQPTVENGEIAIVELNGQEVTCKKFYKEDNQVILKSINTDYDDMIFDDAVRVIGKVIK